MIDYELRAFVALLPLLESWPAGSPPTRPLPLPFGGLAVQPVTASMGDPETWGEQHGQRGRLVFVEADWCGGVGGERAVSWTHGTRQPHVDVASALRTLGAPAGDELQALGLLAHLTRTGWTAAAMVESLSRSSRDALSGLVAALSFRDADERLEQEVRAEAAERLARLGRAARPALPAIRNLLRGEARRRVALAAASALARIGAEGIPMLLAALDDPTTPDRWPPVYALGLAGAEGASTLPALQRLLAQDPSPEVRAACAEVLGRQAAADNAAGLAAALRDEAAGVRARAAEALGRVVDLHGPALAALRGAAAEDDDRHVREVALEALLRLEAL